MRFLNWLAAFFLFLELPIPLYWLILHPQIGFWRRHVRAGYWFAGLTAWGAGAAFVLVFYRRLFGAERAPLAAILAGCALIAADAILEHVVKRDFGLRRLVGHAELQGARELATSGLYARVRHPRYTGMMLSMLGICLIGWTRFLWAVAAVWWLMALAAIHFEERELRARFGPAYSEYAARVPRFLPLRIRAREKAEPRTLAN